MSGRDKFGFYLFFSKVKRSIRVGPSFVYMDHLGRAGANLEERGHLGIIGAILGE